MHSIILVTIGAYLAIISSAAPIPSGPIPTRNEAEQSKRTELYCIGSNSARISDEARDLIKCTFKREDFVTARDISESEIDKRIELYSVGSNHAEIENEDEVGQVSKRIEMYSVGSNHAQIADEKEEDGVWEVGKRSELYCGNGVNNARVSDGDIINPEC